jgi:glucose/arabinose dehydrogenase
MTSPPLVRVAAVALASILGAASATAQASQHALRFYAQTAPQQDRIRIRVDDDVPGPGGSEPCDVGASGFTLELWIRGNLADNPAPGLGGGASVADESWLAGNLLLDRSVWGASERELGVSLAAGRVRFGTGSGDSGSDLANTLEGQTVVLDGAWHHVACVRDAASGVKSIYVDGKLDFASPLSISYADLSYPDQGVGNPGASWNPFLVVAASKHDTGTGFSGFADELRVWSLARSPGEILATYDRVLPKLVPGLVGYWRFEEGSGTSLADSSGAGSPAGTLIAGVAGNGEWKAWGLNPMNTAPILSGSLPSGFQRTLVTDAVSEATTLAVAPDGRLLVGERGGRVLVVSGGALLPQPLIQIPVDTQMGARGLAGLAFDPAFEQNGWLYAYYTTLEPRNRIGRFTVIGNTASLASEQVIWQNPSLASFEHHGGALRFAPDGRLLVATGDQGGPTSQLLNLSDGKILRLERDGSIPPDNPFAGQPGVDPAIWAYGLRNPFRMSVDPTSGTVWIGDVGSDGPTAWEELLRGVPGANFGWPLQEGPNCFVPACSKISFPHHAYRHDDPAYFWSKPQGSITVGPVYRGSAFPPEYQGNLFVGDYANRWIRRLVLDAGGQVQADLVFVPSPEAGTVVDMAVGLDGALYYTTFGNTPVHGKGDPSAVYRIHFNGAGNLPPVAVAGASPTQGPRGVEVQFTSAGTYDPDQGPSPLSYLWDFGDGSGSSAPHPKHVYLTAGLFQARLEVGDGAATSLSDPIAIEVGAPPVAVIDQPPEGTIYRAGDTIGFEGWAAEAEDPALPPTALTWQVMLVHHQHTHPFFGPLSGVASGSFKIPLAGHPPEDTSYEIHLTALAGNGLKGTAVRPIEPVSSSLVFDTVPTGIPILLDGSPETTPRPYESLEGYQHALEAQPVFELGGTTWLFRHWTDGGALAHSFVAPPGGGTLSAVYSAGKKVSAQVAVPAPDRNAEHSPAYGQLFASPSDPLAITAGRDANGPLQAGLAFYLPVPRGARILSASLAFTAGQASAGSPQIEIRAFATGNVPRFQQGSMTPLSAWAPLGAASVSWAPPALAPGQLASTPDLAALVQEVVDRADWKADQAFGLVLDGTPSAGVAWRRIANVASGTPAVLAVEYAVAN